MSIHCEPVVARCGMFAQTFSSARSAINSSYRFSNVRCSLIARLISSPINRDNSSRCWYKSGVTLVQVGSSHQIHPHKSMNSWLLLLAYTSVQESHFLGRFFQECDRPLRLEHWQRGVDRAAARVRHRFRYTFLPTYLYNAGR